MKSRITIEVDFNNGNTPIIQILQRKSDDVRDQLLSAFLQTLQGSSWCKIHWQYTESDPNHEWFSRIFISTIPPSTLEQEAAIMKEQAELNKGI